MYEAFTDRARAIRNAALQKGKELKWGFGTPELLLLALLEHGGCIAVKVLMKIGIDIPRFAGELRERIKTLDEGQEHQETIIEPMPFTPETNRVFKFALEERRRLNHQYVATEHLLLGLIRMEQTMAGAMLHTKGASLSGTRDAIVAFLAEAQSVGQKASPGFGVIRLSYSCTLEQGQIPEQFVPIALQIMEALRKLGPDQHLSATLEFPLPKPT